MIGQRLLHYEILEKLGEGGMGVVYRAIDTKLNRQVAVKVLADELADAAARRRFQREAQTASSLNHPHILTVHDAGEWEDRQYLVTEYVEGGTLKDWLAVGKRTWTEVVQLLLGVADGLATAHAAGILHRDIKPANILIHQSGYAKLADFGLAKLAEEPVLGEADRTLTEGPTKPGVVIGTIAYMSPEQASGKPLDARGDVFSFGVVLYEALAGRRPFAGSTDLEVLQRIIHGTPQPLGVEIPSALCSVVEKALEKDPGNRYQSMREMVIDLRRCARQTGEVSALTAPSGASRGRWKVGGALIGLVLLASAFGLYRWRQSDQPARLEYTELTRFADSVTSPALSPDGRMVTFIRGSSSFAGQGQIYVKFLPDGEPKQLTSDDLTKMSPVFSPDGSRIAYTTVDDRNEWDTWEVPVLGGEPRRWLPNASGLTWAGKDRVLFSEKIRGSKGNHMKLVAAAESRTDAHDVYVPMPKGAMAHRSYPSPDGRWVLLAEMSDRGPWLPCRLVPMDGSSPGWPVGPQGSACWFAAWSPDGKWMYLNSSAGGGFHIWRQRFSERGEFTQPEQITSGPTEEEGISMASDGRSFITAVGMTRSAVWVHDRKGDRQVSLEGVAVLPLFTPDGKKLLYLVGQSGSQQRRELWVADLESRRSEPMLRGFAVVASSARSPYDVSPDGRQVVMEAPDREGKKRLWLAHLDKRSPPLPIPNAEGDGPVFGPSGEIFFRGREGDYGFAFRIRQDGTGLKKAFDYPVTGVMGISPDGKWLAVYARPSEHEAGATLLLPLEGGSPVQLLGHSAHPRWSRDGRFLFLCMARSYYSGQAGRTYVCPLPPAVQVPKIPGGGFRSEAAIAGLPGIRVIDNPSATPGPEPDVYAFSRMTVQRNLYRVPVPGE